MRALALFRFAIIASCVLLTGCNNTAKRSWTDVLAKCTETDTIPVKKMLYLSPSNSIGPGSVWKRNSDGVYALRFTIADAIPGEADRMSLLQDNNAATCDGTRQVTWSLKPSVLLSTDVSPIEGALSVDIDRSTKTVVSVGSWKWVQLKEFKFEQWAKGKDSGKFGVEASTPGRMIMTRAVQVEGFKADMTFSTQVLASLKAKFPVGGATPFKVGAGLEASWKDDLTLSITSKVAFFIAGALRPVSEDGNISFTDELGGGSAQEEVDVPPLMTQHTKRDKAW